MDTFGQSNMAAVSSSMLSNQEKEGDILPEEEVEGEEAEEEGWRHTVIHTLVYCDISLRQLYS